MICKQWFEENNIKIMSWPAISLDLNCIENLWSWLDHNLVKIKIKDMDQMKEEITKLRKKSSSTGLIFNIIPRVNVQCSTSFRH